MGTMRKRLTEAATLTVVAFALAVVLAFLITQAGR